MAYVVAYRTGGWANYQWHRSLPMPQLDEALALQAEVRRGGRMAIVLREDERVNLDGPVPRWAGPQGRLYTVPEDDEEGR